MEDFINSFGVKNLVIVGGVFLVVILALIVLVFFEKRSKKGKDDLDFYDDSKSDFEDDTEVLEDASFAESKEEKLEVKPLGENLSFSPKEESIVASRDLPKEKGAPLLEESVATVTEKQDILEEKESDNMTQTAVDTNNYVNNEKPRPVVTSPIFITRPEPVKKEEDTSYKPKREVFSSVYPTSPTLKKDAPTEVLHIEKEVEPWKTASLKNTVDVDAEADVEADKMFDNLESHVDISSNIDVEPKADFSKLSRVKNEYDKDIMLNILNLSSTITKAYESKSLNELTDYIYKLTSSYNKFYSENRILDEQDNVLRESWLALTKLVLDINLLLLNILGINCPEKM